MTPRPRRKRSPNGERRASKIHRFRDLDPLTDARIRALAAHYGVPMAAVVDAAVASFFASTALASTALASTALASTALGSDGGAGENTEQAARMKTLEAWIGMLDANDRGQPQLPSAERSELETALAARRARLRADLDALAPRSRTGSVLEDPVTPTSAENAGQPFRLSGTETSDPGS